MKRVDDVLKALFCLAERLWGLLLRLSLGLVLLWIGVIHLITPQPVVRLLSLPCLSWQRAPSSMYSVPWKSWLASCSSLAYGCAMPRCSPWRCLPER